MKSFVAALLNSILVAVIINTASWLPADELPSGIVAAERVEAAKVSACLHYIRISHAGLSELHPQNRVTMPHSVL